MPGADVPIHILIVDDDSVSRQFAAAAMAAYFKLGGPVVVSEASDGLTAWNTIQAEPIDVLLTDLLMPAMSGSELCQRVRALEGRYVYVVILSAFGGPGLIDATLGEGADDFLEKPYSADALERRLVVACRIARYCRGVHA